MKKINNLNLKIEAKKAGIEQVLKKAHLRRDSTMLGIRAFDNQSTWDNWPDKSGSPFDNQPTWDDWQK